MVDSKSAIHVPILSEKKSIDQSVNTKTPTSVMVKPQTATEFTPGWRFYVIFVSLSVITLATALDATTLSAALPVRSL